MTSIKYSCGCEYQFDGVKYIENYDDPYKYISRYQRVSDDGADCELCIMHMQELDRKLKKGLNKK